MPQLAPIVLNDGTNDNTFNPSGFNGERAVFVESAVDRLANQPRINTRVRPAAATNTGHLVETVLSFPVPVLDQDGCCVDKDAPAISSFNVRTLRAKTATQAQMTSALAEFRSYVASTAFADLVMGQSYY